MASYPTGVFSPALKNTGNTIQASHVNDLDTEVAAIESGLLVGLQHALVISTGGLSVSTGSVNIGGPSSLATLQVNGTSTFAGRANFSSGITVAGDSTITGNIALTGNLQQTGNSTITGDLVVSGTISAANVGSLPRVKVSHSTTHNLASGTWTGLSWDSETYNSHAMHSTASDSSRITFVDSTGVYSVGAHFMISINGTATIAGGRILMNSTTELMRVTGPATGASTEHGYVIAGDIRVASTTDYITLQAFQTSGSTQSVSSRSNGFWARKVSS